MANEYVTQIATVQEFEQKVERASGTVLVDFWAAWCGPCRMLAPVIEQIAQEKSGDVSVCKVDVDALPELASRFGIMSIPTLLLFRDGKLIDRTMGALPKPMLEKFILG